MGSIAQSAPAAGSQGIRFKAEADYLRAKASWRPFDLVFWLLPIAAYFLLPKQPCSSAGLRSWAFSPFLSI